MRLKKASSIDYVHQFSDMAFMKFKPKKENIKTQIQKPQQQNLFMSRIKSFINWRSSKPTNQSRVSQRSALQRSSSQVSIKSISLQNDLPGSTIIFLQKITPQHYLIGNQNQIDLVSIGGIIGNFIDTESLWQLNIGQPIRNIAIDTKKGYIAIQTNTEIVIYHYDYKKLKQKPTFVSGTKTKIQSTYIRFVKDSILTVFYNNFIDVYVIQENKMRRKMNKQVTEASDMTLFQVPFAAENSINVFYTKKSQTTKTFQLWYIQLNFRGLDPQLSEMMKVYDIKQGLQHKIKLENYSKQIFLMNLGFEILAVKKGYIIDSAYLNIQQESTFLHYIGNNRLLHLSPNKAEIYRFKINFTTNPPRIEINSLDSIEIRKPIDYEYIGALQMFDRNFAVFYQIVPHHNRRTRGEITYCFAITKHVTIQQKIRQIFTFGKSNFLKDVPLELIEQRVDMARKIGLSRTQIYVQLWNRTSKSTVEEFKFLLDTLDYETIKKEIQKKMKKSSMLFRQVYKIEQSCFEMIRENLFSSRCNQEVLKQYLTSHFLLRKLQLYRDITIAQKAIAENQHSNQQESDSLKINIQNYNKYLKADIKNLFLQLIHQFCFENKKVLTHIRIFLRSFRFIFRIVYKQLLQDIVCTTKSSLIILLQNFPQLLPYKHILKQNDDTTLYEGVWQDITRTQWQRNLHIQGISTIDNRQVIAQIPSTLWFRRNFLTQHDMTGKSRQQIIKIHKSNNSESIFYFFISNVFQYVTEQEPLKKIIQFVQRNYDKMPSHLHSKIFLYRKFFQYINSENLSKNNQRLKNFHELLQMKDYELFKQFFQFQKVKKGCLLKDIKKIYEQIGSMQESYIMHHSGNNQQYQLLQNAQDKNQKGTQWFNESILSYFSSNFSEVSDLKYILNRINNQKRQFFAQNQSLIYVLVQSVQLKLRIGSEKDVPIQEVLQYLQNIPLPLQSPVLHELQKIQKISEQVQRFQQIKINMTISEITKNCQNVINALINNEIKKRKVMQVKSMQEMIDLSYDIIAQIQVVKQKIYMLEYSDLAFFVYLTKIMQQVHMIPYAAELLNDKNLKKHYSVDLKVVEDLILYMYKLKLSQNPKYIENQDYLVQLLKILPEDNQCRIYIQCEIEYAKILSAPNNAVQYPLTDKSDGISIVQVQERIQQLPGQFLLQIDIQKLHKIMNKMQQICYEDFQANFYTTLNEIYQTIILKLIQDNKVVNSIPLVKQLLQLSNNQYGVIFPLIYIDLISQQLTVQCKRNLLKAVSFLFNQPLQLLAIVQQLIGKVFTNLQRDNYFKNLAIKSSQYKKNYNPKNPILDPVYLELIRNQEMENNFRNMVEQCGHHLVKTKEDFNTFQYSLLFVILTQNPYVLGKYIFCRRYHTNYKVMRSFLSYVIKQEIFDAIRVLQFGRRVFNIVLQASQSVLTLQSISSQYSTISIDQTIQFQQMIPVQPVLPTDDQIIKKAKVLQSKLQKCIQAFDKKQSSVRQQFNKNGPKQNVEKKKARIQKQLTNPIDLSQKAPSQYPFGDSDDDYGEEQKFQDILKSLKKKKKHKQFNPSLQRNLLMNRTTKNYALFMSSQMGQKEQSPMYLSSRGGIGQHRKLKNTKAYAMEGNNSLKLSQNQFFGRLSLRQPKSKRSQQYSGRISEQMALTQSIEGFGVQSNFVSKSAVVKNRRAYTVEYEDLASPLQNHSMQESKQIEQQDFNQINSPFYRKEKIQVEDNENKNYQLNVQQLGLKSSEKIINLDLNDYNMYVDQKSRKISGDLFHVNVQQIDENAFMPVQKIKTMILDSLVQEGDQFYVDLGQLSLQQDKDNGQFTNYIKQIISSLYNDQNIKSKCSLKIIKDIQSLYPDIEISKEFLDIYIRFQSYHSKYDISIAMKEMFPIQFIFEKAKQPKKLFDLIVQQIVKLVDQSNIYKISKIIHLAFKASTFEHEFFFRYLCLATEKFDIGNMSQNELNMQLQKLTALIDKLPIHIVAERGQKLIQKMGNKERKQKIIEGIVNYLKKKKSGQEVEKIEKMLKSK